MSVMAAKNCRSVSISIGPPVCGVANRTHSPPLLPLPPRLPLGAGQVRARSPAHFLSRRCESMVALSPLPTDPSRKNLQGVLRRLARMPLADIAAAIEKDESTASRLRSGEAKLTVEEFSKLLAAIGCKVVDQRKK